MDVKTPAYLLSHTKTDTHILDVGCDNRLTTINFAKLVPRGQVIGVDCRRNAIDTANEAALSQNITNTKFIYGDKHVLPFPNESFDIVHTYQLLVHLPYSDPVDALKEMRRVCKTGGLVSTRVSDWPTAVVYPLIPGVKEALDLIVHCICRHKGTSPYGGRLREWARTAGLPKENIVASAVVIYHANPRQTRLWGEFMATILENTDFLGKSVSLGLVSQQNLVDMSSGWRRWSAHDDAFFSIVNCQMICKK